ncbi:hypothetical protein D4764_12G0004280 [Takifugu flavidus]|uniref:Reverse transcriptase domain-containing protein n=1 Tax=Takifugu flavidus TaxID=433684 RepID=A0A5C6PEH1_9TELE|nr:hypothetical protein D4764_12G0004280 [Takifugu flavidus]
MAPHVDHMQLVLLCTEKDFKNFGHAKVFSELLTDLKELEKNGITMGDELVVKGALYSIAGDNLGSHTIGADPNICGLELTPETYRSAIELLETEDAPQRSICFRPFFPLALLNEKKRVFRSGDKEELRRVQKELRRGIRRGKDSYRRKLEERLKGSNAREVWRGLKTISGQTKDSGRGPESGGLDWANKLNSFFNMFDCTAPPSPTHQSPDLAVLSLYHPPSPPVTPPAPAVLSSHHATSLHPLPDQPSQSNPHPHPPGVTPRLSITADQVRKELRRTKTRKATGPDGINSRLLKDCADQLCGVLLHIFNLSLSLERVPLLWKTSCVVPVLKTAHAREPNHFRPVALTSHLMKTMERIVLTHLRQLVDSKMDPLQFAYRLGIGVDDAVIYLLHRSLSHLEGTRSTVRVMFFDFSLLRGKMEGAGVDCHLAAWTTDYLTNRLQYVRLRDCESDVVVCSTGAPQDTVLSPFLFTLYSSDFSHNSDSCHLQKFSDDTAIVGRVSKGNELEYREVITNFVAWCELNHLRINTSKTNEVVIDFSRKASHIAPVNIQGMDIEIVEEYKYLGVHLNNKLDWTHNTDALYKKGQSNLHLLRRLRSFGVCRSLLRTFYDSVVASVIFYAVVCWSCGSSERDRKRLNKLVRRAGSLLDCSLDSIDEVRQRLSAHQSSARPCLPILQVRQRLSAHQSSARSCLPILQVGEEARNPSHNNSVLYTTGYRYMAESQTISDAIAAVLPDLPDQVLKVSPFLSLSLPGHSLASIIHSYIIILRKLLSACTKLGRHFSGSSCFAAETFMLSIDNEIVNNCFTSAICLMFGSYYCFNFLSKKTVNFDVAIWETTDNKNYVSIQWNGKKKTG